MPIYEFRCTTCGNHFDRLQKLSDPDPDRCPECGKPTIKRCVTAPAFRLAGSGWYETDFKKDGEKKHNLAGKDEAPKGDTPKADAGKVASESKSADPSGAKSEPATKPAPAEPD